MVETKNIFVLIGSASLHSANQILVDCIAKLMQDKFHFIVYPDLKTLPHFDPELCISTTIFSDKATGLITASASGEKAHEELQLIMKTAMAKFSMETTLLIQGVKGKINEHGQLIDKSTLGRLTNFANDFSALVHKY